MSSCHDTQRDAEHMFELLDFARCHGRKIPKDQISHFGSEIHAILQKLLIGEYLKKVEKEHVLFYALTSRGLNLFAEKRKSQSIPAALKVQIIEQLEKALTELEVKPWEVMVHIIHVIGDHQTATTGDILQYFATYFGDLKGTSKANVYRNIKHLRMKGYIEYQKETYTDQSQYKLSQKGEEVFYMTKANATQKMRTSEEWDNALREIFGRMAEEQKRDEKVLFYTLDTVIPDDLDNAQIVWVLYMQANVYELKGNLDKAEEAYLRMEGLCEELKDARGRAYALKGMGNVCFKKKKYSIAEQYYNKCLRIIQDAPDTALLSDVLNNKGSCSYARDDIDGALHQFENALTLVANDTARAASILYNIGLCYACKEDLGKAKEFWLNSLQYYQELTENVTGEWVEYNLREIDRKQKEEHLEENYRKAKHTGTSDDIKKAYKDLVTFKMSNLISRGF
ncbi:MAG: tetratricopeptide repeat protein [Candidatus Methanofastidiosia archaeon]